MTETINQSEIYYDLAGEGSRRVLLLHGWGCDHSLMKPVADSLKNDFRILMPDFPGHGQSPEPPEPWGVSDYAGQIVELMHQLDFVPSAVIAHSFGSLNLNRVEAQHETTNPASGAVMRKCGMIREGTLRSRLCNKGRYVDVDLYAILRKDYQRAKGAKARVSHA